MKLLIVFILPFWISLSTLALALDLNTYLNEVQTKNKGIKALDLSNEATDYKRLVGDMPLVPSLQIKTNYLRDQKLPNPYGASENQTTMYSLGFNKKFETGTQLGLLVNAGHIKNPGIASAQSQIMGDYVNGALGISLSQSLLKDSFGRATQLRQSRETLIREAEKMAIYIQTKILMIEAEKAFWDLIYQQKEIVLRKASLSRAERIHQWVAKRLNDGIGDRGDLLNAKALLANRKLQLQSAEDDLKSAEQKIRIYLDLESTQNVPLLTGDLSLKRSDHTYLNNLSTFKNWAGFKNPPSSHGQTISLEALAKFLESQIQKIGLAEVTDSLKSDLVLSGSYTGNPYQANGDFSDVTGHLADLKRPTSTLALTWTYLFDTDVKSAQENLARKNSLSSQIKSEQLVAESDSQWKEYQRHYETLSQRIQTFQEISNLQNERAQVEQDKYSKGRSITQYVITAEQDAAEAELNLQKLKAEQRKMETQSQLFIRIE